MDCGNALLDSLDPQDRAAALALATPFSEPNGALVRPGAGLGTWAHFPVKGVLAALWIAPDGRTVETGLCGVEGVWPSQPDAVQPASRHRLLALADVQGWRIDLEELKALAVERIRVREVLRAHSARVALETEEGLASAALDGVDQRLARLLLRLHDRSGGKPLKVTQETLGSLLASQRTTVNEAAQNLQKRGAIAYRRGKITVRDRGVLDQARRGDPVQSGRQLAPRQPRQPPRLSRSTSSAMLPTLPTAARRRSSDTQNFSAQSGTS